MMAMKLHSLIYFTLVFFVTVWITETRRNNHNYNSGHLKRFHPCPVPRGRNGVCVRPDMCAKPSSHFETNGKRNHFCRPKNRYQSPMICCLEILNLTVDRDVETTENPEVDPDIIEHVENVDKLMQEKCAEYARVAADVEMEDGSSESGSRGLFQPFVVGGTTSLSKEFPHMALLGFGTEDNIEWKCGGSLISDKFVLTAAHCLYSSSVGDVNFVRLGDLNINSNADDAKPQRFRVAQRYTHPDYISGVSQYNDIALLQLEQSVTFTKYARPACIQAVDDASPHLIATGWGTTEFGGPTSDTLQKVNLVYYSYEMCNKTFGPQMRLERGVDEDSQICAGGAEGEEKDTCQGDSGGPLQIEINNSPKMYRIVGVVSFGKGCGLPNVPGVYSKVSYYSPWIADIVWGHGLELK